MGYQQHLELNRLRREAFFEADPVARNDSLTALVDAPGRGDAEREWLFLKSKTPSGLLSGDTTGLDVTVTVKLPQVPTSVVHLLEPDKFPLVHCRVANTSKGKRRVRVTSYVEGYSAKAVDTMELNDSGNAGFEREFHQLPSFFPKATRNLQDITRAMLNVLVDDLDSGKVELHVSRPVWLLPRSSAPRSLRDPDGKRLPVDKFLAAFVTPNAQAVFELLGVAVTRHPQKRFAGYQDPVAPQVRALYEALQQDVGLKYINSVIAFSMEGWASQRVRLPRESLDTKSANCIDGVVLFASLLESISLSAALAVIDQGHAMVAWESKPDASDWTYLETTKIGSTATFDDALASGKEQAGKFLAANPPAMDTLALRDLREGSRIMPLE